MMKVIVHPSQVANAWSRMKTTAGPWCIEADDRHPTDSWSWVVPLTGCDASWSVTNWMTLSDLKELTSKTTYERRNSPAS